MQLQKFYYLLYFFLCFFSLCLKAIQKKIPQPGKFSLKTLFFSDSLAQEISHFMFCLDVIFLNVL